MDKQPFSFRSIIFTIIFSFIILFFLGFEDFFYHKTKIIFCDVGQGDAAYIRTKEKIDILVDAGPGRQVLTCLGKYMPFYDRKIEIAILSHPQNDHFRGYLDIVERYGIDYFITLPLDNNNHSFNLLKRKLHQKKINIKNLYAGEKIILNNKKNHQSLITFLWPSKDYLAKNINQDFFKRKDVLGAFSINSDLNDFSLVFLFSWLDFDVLFTGDVSSRTLNLLTDTINNKLIQKKIEVLKIPHHGSKNGLTKKFLQLADPQLCVISVGKKNTYGHPSNQVINMLKALKKRYLRTDERGDIVVEVDERGWRLK